MSQSPNAEELRSKQESEAALMAALPEQIAHAEQSAPAFAKILSGIGARTIHTREKLQTLPITRKTDLLRIQQENRHENVLGGLAAVGFGPEMPRIFASPGIIFEPQGSKPEHWRLAWGLRGAGVQAGDVVQHCL